MVTTLDCVYTATALSLSYWLYVHLCIPPRDDTVANGYILINSVTHARNLPVEASHAFQYPTLTFLLNVKSLTEGRLDLGTMSSTSNIFNLASKLNPIFAFLNRPWIFGTGSTAYSRLTNLRPAAYLLDNRIPNETLLERLEEFGKLQDLSKDELGLDEYGEVWLMTSPSYLGVEGINPLSVWFCYGSKRELRTVLLEVHNTFEERHVYVLRTGIKEDSRDGFTGKHVEHQWTIPRQFHVSPFNDRAGFYVCSLSGVTHPHTSGIETSNSGLMEQSPTPRAPRPVIRLNVLTPSKELKMTAITRTTHSLPLTSSKLLWTLLQHPFLLLLSMIRISYQAAILHYRKRLDVFARPEPIISLRESNPRTLVNGNPPELSGTPSGVGVGWQKEGWLEKCARKRVDHFLRRKAQELGIDVRLIPANPVNKSIVYSAIGGILEEDSRPLSTHDSTRPILTIHYLSSVFFVHLWVLPSSQHALLFGSKAEEIFVVNNEDLFLRTFSSNEVLTSSSNSYLQRLRAWFLPNNALDVPFPMHHALDESGSGIFNFDWTAAMVILAFYTLQNLEYLLYKLFAARFVRGDEPWDRWSRLNDGKKKDSDLGSIRHE